MIRWLTSWDQLLGKRLFLQFLQRRPGKEQLEVSFYVSLRLALFFRPWQKLFFNHLTRSKPILSLRLSALFSVPRVTCSRVNLNAWPMSKTADQSCRGTVAFLTGSIHCWLLFRLFGSI